jgi:hypothetical protein
MVGNSIDKVPKVDLADIPPGEREALQQETERAKQA